MSELFCLSAVLLSFGFLLILIAFAGQVEKL
jgi:hypothetical protein